jgi:hypothetical protein
MLFNSWGQETKRKASAGSGRGERRQRKRHCRRPTLEGLEDRRLLAVLFGADSPGVPFENHNVALSTLGSNTVIEP